MRISSAVCEKCVHELVRCNDGNLYIDHDKLQAFKCHVLSMEFSFEQPTSVIFSRQSEYPVYHNLGARAPTLKFSYKISDVYEVPSDCPKLFLHAVAAAMESVNIDTKEKV